MLVQMASRGSGSLDNRDASFCEMALQCGARKNSRTLKSQIIACLRIAHIDRTTAGIHRHVEQSRAHATHCGTHADRLRIDGEQVLIWQIKSHGVAPITLASITPSTGSVCFHNQPHPGCRHACLVGGRTQGGSWHLQASYGARGVVIKTITGQLGSNRCGSVTAVQGCRVDRSAIG